MTRRRLLTAAAALALVLGLVVVLVPGEQHAPVRSPSQGRQAARDACALFGEFDRLVAENGSADRVRQVLGRAVRRAGAAAQYDATWVALSGGLQSVQLALEADDPRAARLGVDVTRTECVRPGRFVLER